MTSNILIPADVLSAALEKLESAALQTSDEPQSLINQAINALRDHVKAASPVEEKFVFAVSPGEKPSDAPMISIGVPKGAWDYMRDGKTHHLDLSPVGIPVRMMLFGAETHDEAMKVLQEAAKRMGASIRDERRRDFGMKLRP